MRILLLSHYFPPEVNAPANRVHEHARVWARDGHVVTVVTNVPNHPRGEIFRGYANARIQEERIDGIRVIRPWTYAAANAGFLRRTLNYLVFAFAAVLASWRVEKPDVAVATSPQFFVGLAGAVVARMKRCRFVLEVRDLWPDSIVQLGQVRSPTAIRLLERIETWLYHRADGIVVVTHAFAEHVLARGVRSDRVTVVYNGIDTERFRPQPASDVLLREQDLEDTWRVAYVGTLGLAHGLDTVLEAADRLRDAGITFLFVGDGADRARLEAIARQRALPNVRFPGLRPRGEMPAWIASCDCLLVMLRDLAVFETVIPSKIFEFLAQERPVILAARGEIRRLVEEAKAAFVIDPEQPKQLAEAVQHVRERPEEAEARARAGREWVEKHFRRETLARKMEGFLEARVGAER